MKLSRFAAAVLALAAVPALAQSTSTDTTTQTTNQPGTTTVTSPDGTKTTVQPPAASPNSGTTVTPAAPPAATTPAPTTVTGSGGDVTYTPTTSVNTGGPKTGGLEVSLLGGGIGYRTSIQGGTNVGPAYGVAVGAKAGGSGLELSYQGATYTPSGTSDLTGGASRITENGGQALLKLGPQMGPVDLYVLGGAGISRFNVSGGSAATPGITNVGSIHDGTIYKVPAGAGLDIHVPTGGPDVLIGARGQYNFLFNKDNVFTGGNTSNGSRDADQIEAQVNLGMLF